MPPLDAKLAAPAVPLDSAPDTAGQARAPEPLPEEILRHHAWLDRILTFRYGPVDGPDIAQDTWLRLHTAGPKAPVRSPKSFLMRVAKGLAIDRFRRARFELVTDPDHTDFTERRVDDAQEQAVFFEQMMLALPPKLRDVFVLTHVKGLTYREIAQLKGISVKAVEKRMTQAIARCAEMLRG
jgi:RNA polymerase sigma factor (sigma-70 family)